MPQKNSPFHAGEIAIQRRIGVAEQVHAQYGSGFVTNYLPTSHRYYFMGLPFVICGFLDMQGRPWAVPVWSAEGFLTSPDLQSLHLEAPLPFSDALDLDLADGAKVGVLGIDVQARQRARMNGRLQDVSERGLTILVEQSYGNCPQYIHRREAWLADPNQSVVSRREQVLSDKSRALIERADTFFITSRTAELSQDPRSGVDTSHRGGRPGFVKVSDDGVLTFPDFAGNHFFNTLGNIEVDGRVGLCFADWTNGDILFVTGQAKIIWDPERVEVFSGAERLVDLQIEDSLFVEHAFAEKGGRAEPWPVLELTGTWAEADAEGAKRGATQTCVVTRRETQEDGSILLWLEPWDGRAAMPSALGEMMSLSLIDDVPKEYPICKEPDGQGYFIAVSPEDAGLEGVQVNDVVKVARL